MPLGARFALIGGILLLAYYALIFGYAARMRAERHEHVAWRFPLRAGSDFCADPLPNGACVCSDAGTVYIVKEGKALTKFVAYQGNAETREYPPYEGYQWVGGTSANLAFVSAARPPMNELSLYAIDCSGKVRWEAKLPPGETTAWIACSPDSVFVQTYNNTAQVNGQGMNPTMVLRYSLDGKLIYSVKPGPGQLQIEVTKDDWVYLADSSWSMVALDPSGNRAWKTKTGGYMPAYSSHLANNTLYYLDSMRKLHGVGRDGKERFATLLPTATSRGWTFGDTMREVFSSNPYGGGWNNFNTSTLADGGGQIYAIDGNQLTAIGSDGKQRWQRELRSQGQSVAADSKGRAYVALYSGGLACYGPDGKELWRNSSLHHITSAMSVGTDDRVLVEADNELLCIR